jgi:chromosome segregation ATPase
VSDGGLSAVAGALLGGSAGVVGSEALRSLRERRTLRLAERKAPSEIESVVSAGAKDAVAALRETLSALRQELTDLRDQCKATEAKNTALEVALGDERASRAQLAREVADLRRRLGEEETA